ncbi:MAG: polysaccharide biosynthesis protein [Kouleothrix sp.]|nr:polysaccharide biosynthesis protein [Kouleothrix sp.]
MRYLRNRYFFIADVLLLPLAAYLSFVLRFDSFALQGIWPSYLNVALVGLAVIPLVFILTGIYSRYWDYASVDELLLLAGALTLAVCLSSAASLGLQYALALGSPLPRSVPFVFLLLALAVTATPRVVVRGLVHYRRKNLRRTRLTDWSTLVVGAGDAGEMIVREIQRTPHLGLEVVGFVDDNPAKHAMRIHGVPVLGDRSDIPRLVEHYNVHRVIIAMPTAPGSEIREIVGICDKVGVKAKIIPSINELLSGSAKVNQLRDVQIEDLLRRAPIQTDIAAVGELVRGRRVLITGGGGSIGSELCRQVMRCRPAELVVLGHGENSVFEIYNELRRTLAAGARTLETSGEHSVIVNRADATECRLSAVIADIRFADRLQSVFDEYRPEIVFHAAAHKHVPLMELNPAEAITNNVLGTRNLLKVAQSVGVGHFVMISSDKAVNPTSVMGASKRVAELLVHEAAMRSGKPYVAVRFGNVLGSRGSVVLTFRQQIASGGPVTITHPDMRRFFMTIPEAVQLTLQAAVLGQSGAVFVLDMGEPIKIVDLARDLIELSGMQPGKDIEIAFTGLRPGEKLFEELFVPGESYARTRHDKIFIAANASSFVPQRLGADIESLHAAAQRNDVGAILHGLQRIIPEFQPPQLLELEPPPPAARQAAAALLSICPPAVNSAATAVSAS